MAAGKRTTDWARPVGILSLVTLLGGCGGGSSGSNTENTTVSVGPVASNNSAPVADAGADQSVNTGATVILAGMGTDTDGDTLTYRWTPA